MSFALALGPWLIIIALVIVVLRYVLAARAGNFAPPIVVNPGAAMLAIQNALAGNGAAALTALADSFHLQIAAGSVEEKLFQAGFLELELRAADPNAKLPVIDYIAHFSNRTRDQVIAFLEAEGGIKRQTPATATSLPVIPVASATAAILLCLCLSSVASAKSPIRAPQVWQPERHEIQIDPAVFSRPVSIAHRNEILLPDRQYVSFEPIYPTGHYQPASYQSGNVGFWQRGPVRRWAANGGPVRQWFAHRRWRLFGRRC